MGSEGKCRVKDWSNRQKKEEEAPVAKTNKQQKTKTKRKAILRKPPKVITKRKNTGEFHFCKGWLANASSQR